MTITYPKCRDIDDLIAQAEIFIRAANKTGEEHLQIEDSDKKVIITKKNDEFVVSVGKKAKKFNLSELNDALNVIKEWLA